MNIHLQISENPSQQSGAAIKLSGYYTGNKKNEIHAILLILFKFLLKHTTINVFCRLKFVLQKQINTVVQYITEAQAQGAETLLENDDDHGIELSNVDNMNFGSDACSDTLRFRHTYIFP